MSEEHLVSAPSEQPGITMRSTGGSNKQALKVAGLTVLAALLIAGQAFTAYSVYNQSEKLSLLERRSDRLQELTIKARANRTPMKMAVPMRSFPLLVSADVSDKKVEDAPPTKAPLTRCQQEAAGLIPISLPSFKPKCDEQGAYTPEQCWQETHCWCVDKDGVPVPDSVVEGHAQCNAA
ncbi:CD74 molecule, major histocompatibility complex, class II invariant chain b [Clarias gariepinus]|uniref:CD74 molecule, major histocompatibility complex, class II invariant chain b n=1 Tax=Clarias gariepinus TaxID=13013 RepID=UPI00234CCB36|nr:CD74 molecule, major histocompatibility complex, class II invariant chain b [Clarias gariepinus]